MKFILKRRVESFPVPLLLNLLSLWETVWVFKRIWSNQKRRNWHSSIYGIYSEPVIFRMNFGMILIGLRAKKMDAGLYSIHFMRGDPGSLCCMERDGQSGWLVVAEINACRREGF